MSTQKTRLSSKKSPVYGPVKIHILPGTYKMKSPISELDARKIIPEVIVNESEKEMIRKMDISGFEKFLEEKRERNKKLQEDMERENAEQDNLIETAMGLKDPDVAIEYINERRSARKSQRAQKRKSLNKTKRRVVNSARDFSLGFRGGKRNNKSRK